MRLSERVAQWVPGRVRVNGQKENPAGFNPEAIAKFETDSFRYAPYDPQKALDSRSEYHLALLRRFGLTSENAKQVALTELVADRAATDQERVGAITLAHVLIVESTVLNYDANEAGRLTAIVADPSKTDDRVLAHAQIQGLMFNIPREEIGQLASTSARYFEGRKHQGNAIGLDFSGQNGRREWMKAQAAFADFYSQLEAIRLQFNPEVISIGLAVDPALEDSSQIVFSST